MKRFKKYVIQQDRTMYWRDEVNKLIYYVSAWWDDQQRDHFNITIREDSGARLKVKNTVETSPDVVVQTMKAISQDLRTWHVTS